MRRGVTSAAPRRKGKRFEGGRGGGREGRREGPGTAARPPPARPKALWERFSSARPLPCNLAVSSVISGDLAQRGCWERGPPPPPLRAPGAGSRSCELSRSRGLQVEVGCRQQWAAGSRSCELSTMAVQAEAPRQTHPRYGRDITSPTAVQEYRRSQTKDLSSLGCVCVCVQCRTDRVRRHRQRAQRTMRRGSLREQSGAGAKVVLTRV